MAKELSNQDKIFASNLKKVMDYKGIKAVKLQELCGVGHPTIYDIINGNRPNVNINIVSKLADGLGVSIGVLLSDREPSPEDLQLLQTITMDHKRLC